MKLHRLLCALGDHFFVKLGHHWRGCCVCHQQQRYIEDAWGRHGFWMNIMPQGRIEESRARDAVATPVEEGKANPSRIDPLTPVQEKETP